MHSSPLLRLFPFFPTVQFFLWKWIKNNNFDFCIFFPIRAEKWWQNGTGTGTGGFLFPYWVGHWKYVAGLTWSESRHWLNARHSTQSPKKGEEKTDKIWSLEKCLLFFFFFCPPSRHILNFVKTTKNKCRHFFFFFFLFFDVEKLSAARLPVGEKQSKKDLKNNTAAILSKKIVRKWNLFWQADDIWFEYITIYLFLFFFFKWTLCTK